MTARDFSHDSKCSSGFVEHTLPDGRTLRTGTAPPELVFAEEAFEDLWELHPAEFGKLQMHGKWVKMPRWQAIFGADYHYSGQAHPAGPIPRLLEPHVAWARAAIDPRLNGVVMNFYDGKLGHYIGKHRDSTRNMIAGAPIIMLSFGETRTLRMRPWKRSGKYVDFTVANGAVVVLPYDTNLVWTHEITRSARCRGRRVSVTLRRFQRRGAAVIELTGFPPTSHFFVGRWPLVSSRRGI